MKAGAVITFCSDCAHKRQDSESQPPWYWYCNRHPRLEGFGFVTRRWRPDPPFLKCVDLNGGACPLFEQRNDEDA